MQCKGDLATVETPTRSLAGSFDQHIGCNIVDENNFIPLIRTTLTSVTDKPCRTFFTYEHDD